MAKLKRLSVIKVASFLGIYGMFLGLIAGLIVFLITNVLRNVYPVYSLGDNITNVFFIPGVNGVLTLLIIALIFGVFNFFIGLIFTPIVNLTLRIINGIDLKLEIDGEIQQGKPLEVPKPNLEYLPNNQREFLY